MQIRHHKEIPMEPVHMDGAEGASRQMAISSTDGAPTFSMRVFTVAPGGHTPYHRHPFEHVNYVIEGRGELLDEAGVAHPIEAGDFALVLPDEKHQFRNPSEKDPLVFICAVPKSYE